MAVITGPGQQKSTGQLQGNKVPSGYKLGQIQNFTPEMMELFHQLFGHVGPDSYLSKLAGGDQSMFNEIEAPAKQQFAGLQGNLASRFSGMGLGARKSSGFQNTMNQASSDFAQQLQSQRQQMQQQAIKDLFGLSTNLLGQRPYEQSLIPEQQSAGSQFFSALGGGLGRSGGSYIQRLLGGLF